MYWRHIPAPTLPYEYVRWYEQYLDDNIINLDCAPPSAFPPIPAKHYPPSIQSLQTHPNDIKETQHRSKMPLPNTATLSKSLPKPLASDAKELSHSRPT